MDLLEKKILGEFLAWDTTSPTPSTPLSAPGSPAPHPPISGYHFNPSIFVSELIYSSKFTCHPSFSAFLENEEFPIEKILRHNYFSPLAQNDPDSWVVIETTTKPLSGLY